MIFNLSKLLYMLLYLIYSAIGYWVMQQFADIGYSEWLTYSNILVFTTIGIQYMMARYLKMNIFSVAGLFLVFTYLFHFSHLFLLYINYSFPELLYAVGLYRYGEEVFRQAINYSLLMTHYVFLGMIFAKKINKTRERIIANEEFEDDRLNNKFYRIAGIVLLFISLPLDIYILMNQITGMLAGGYTAVHEVEINAAVRIFSYLVNPAFFLILISYRRNKRIAIAIFSIYIIYKFGTMFTGQRAYAILNILFMLYLYHHSVKYFSKRSIIWGLVCGYITLSLFMIIRIARISGMDSVSFYQNIQQVDLNPIFGTLEEFGGTINVVCEAISRVTEFANGGQIATAFLSVIPFISSILNDINFEDYNLILKLDIWNLGGSYIADFYFDFGMFGILAGILYGYLIYTLSQFIENMLLQEKYYKVAMFIPVIVDIIFSVRSTITKIPRILVWIPLIMIILQFVLSQFRQREEERGNLNA